MKVKDLLNQDIDIDVADDVCEELYIAFCGPIELTEAGMQKFAEVLEYEIELCNDIVIVHIDDDDEDVWESQLKKAKEFFHSLAGYCSSENYEKWFKEVS